MTPSARHWLIALAVLLALPAFTKEGPGLGTPHIWNGDEPHYLVMINSLVQDLDLDLANNYRSVHQGGRDAGKRMAGWMLDHHSYWWREGRSTYWGSIYETNPTLWARDAEGHAVPTLRAGASDREVVDLPERPIHPLGLPLLLSTVTWPLRNTRLLEPACVLLAVLAVIASMLLFHAMALRLTDRPSHALAVTAATFLASPLWHYGRSIFNENFLTLLLLGAYFLAIFTRRSTVWSGLLIALGMLMKPPFALVAMPLLFWLASRRQWLRAAVLAVPCALSTASILLSNWWLHGSALASDQPFAWGNPLTSPLGMMFDPRHGLLPWAPLVAFGIAGWPRLLRSRPELGTLLVAAALYFGLIAVWKWWWGGWCFGPRLIVPIIPVLMLGGLSLRFERPALRRFALALALLAVALNGYSALAYWKSFTDLPMIFAGTT